MHAFCLKLASVHARQDKHRIQECSLTFQSLTGALQLLMSYRCEFIDVGTLILAAGWHWDRDCATQWKFDVCIGSVTMKAQCAALAAPPGPGHTGVFWTPCSNVMKFRALFTCNRVFVKRKPFACNRCTAPDRVLSLYYFVPTCPTGAISGMDPCKQPC